MSRKKDKDEEPQMGQQDVVEEKDTVTMEELAASDQPMAPEKPIYAPPDADPTPAQFDDTEPAPEGAPIPATE